MARALPCGPRAPTRGTRSVFRRAASRQAVQAQALRPPTSGLSAYSRSKRFAAAASPGASVAHEAAPNLALKEWALACAALSDGTQTVLIRKGGLKDPVFKPKASSFFLFPTAFHNAKELVTEDAVSKYPKALEFQLGELLELGLIAELTGCWTTLDPSVLELTSEFHVWSEGLLSTRMKWKPTQPLTVMELRCSRIMEPVRVPMMEDYKGCFSWVDVREAVSPCRELPVWPVMGSGDFSQKQSALRERLAAISTVDCMASLSLE
mmetsp:Transcript_21302/g.59185  ORF Transcript_21302/g.59185 Transcript_21302/m.59185 type:complete len:265 (-) Transcript_21302:26-820(-)